MAHPDRSRPPPRSTRAGLRRRSPRLTNDNVRCGNGVLEKSGAGRPVAHPDAAPRPVPIELERPRANRHIHDRRAARLAWAQLSPQQDWDPARSLASDAQDAGAIIGAIGGRGLGHRLAHLVSLRDILVRRPRRLVGVARLDPEAGDLLAADEAD